MYVTMFGMHKSRTGKIYDEPATRAVKRILFSCRVCVCVCSRKCGEIVVRLKNTEKSYVKVVA